MRNAQLLRRDDLIFSEQTYQIIGVLFKVFKEFGYGYHEKHYYRVIYQKLLAHGFTVKYYVSIPIIFNGK